MKLGQFLRRQRAAIDPKNYWIGCAVISQVTQQEHDKAHLDLQAQALARGFDPDRMADMTGFMRLSEPVLRRLAESYPTGAGLLTGGVVGETELIDVVSESASPWFQENHYGFVLQNAKPLPFMPYKGQLGFFDIPMINDAHST